MNFKTEAEALRVKVQAAFQSGISMADSESLANEFLDAKMRMATEMTKLDLDARMRKQGVKAIKAAIYMEAATKDLKKPSDTLLEHLVNQNALVMCEQTAYDEAEVALAEVERIYANLHEAMILYRGIAKGGFGG